MTSSLLSLVSKAVINQGRLIRDRLLIERLAAQHKSCRLDPRAFIRIAKGCQLRLGEGVVVGAFSLVAIEGDHLSATPETVTLEIGDRTYIGELNNIRAAGRTVIGANCLISQGVSIIGSNHSSRPGMPMTEQTSRTDKLGVTIGDDVWIGTNSTILPGVTIGSGAIIAAGSVVTSDVAANTVVAGCPARFLKARQ